MRSEFKFAILLVVVTGCSDAHAFHYSCAGRLLDSQGNAVAGVQLYLSDPTGIAYEHGDKSEDNHRDQDTWTYWGTTTDESGNFQGSFQIGETYAKWLGVVPPVSPPARMLDAVYVVVHRGDEWVPILVPLDASMQPKGHDGGRQIDLPPVTLPAGK